MDDCMKRMGAAVLGASLFATFLTSLALGDTVPKEPVEHVYAVSGGVELKAYVFSGGKPSPRQRRPAMVLFHGGGWAMGEPQWAFPRARHFADRGMVTIAAQYRLSDQKEVTPLEAMADARAVIRWMRTHADSLDIDPRRIVGYGWSAGVHLAASAAIFEDGTSREKVSGAPNALVLGGPADVVGAARTE